MITLILKILVGLFLLAAICIFAVDGFFWLLDRYCRFHIGRWPDPQEWEEAVCRVARKWARKTPTVKITDNSRYMLLDMLNGRYRSQSIQSWQTAAVILGLLEKGELETAGSTASRFLNSSGNWRKVPVAADSSILAYAILKAAENPQKVKPAMDFMIALIERNIDKNGTIAYTNSADPNRYVDTLGLVCPFLALYANTYGCPEYEVLACNQLRFYHDRGLLTGCALPNHAIHVQTKLPLGVYGWGRGVAWYVIGLVDTYASLTDQALKREVLGWIREAAEAYRPFQRQDGGFGSILQISTSYDSSATAALAWFYGHCARLLQCEAYAACADRCLAKLRGVTRITGKIDWCQGDTKGIGIFAQTYDIMPFAQGFALRAINLQNKEHSYDAKDQN